MLVFRFVLYFKLFIVYYISYRLELTQPFIFQTDHWCMSLLWETWFNKLYFSAFMLFVLSMLLDPLYWFTFWIIRYSLPSCLFKVGGHPSDVVIQHIYYIDYHGGCSDIFILRYWGDTTMTLWSGLRFRELSFRICVVIRYWLCFHNLLKSDYCIKLT